MIKLPRLLRWVLSIVLFFFVLLTIFRFIFFSIYKPSGYPFPWDAFGMGVLIALRSVCALGLFILLLCSIPKLNPFKNIRSRIFWNILLTIIFLFAIFFYLIDYFL